MSLFVTLALSWLALIFALNSVRWQMTDPAAQAFVVIGVFLVARPTVIALGLDTLVPDSEFSWRDPDALMVRTQIAVIVFIAAFALAHKVFRPSTDGRRPSRLTPTDDRAARWVLALAAIAVVTTAPYWVRYGGIQGLTVAAKGRSLEGSARLFRIPAVAAAYFGVAVAIAVDPRTGTRRWKVRGWTAFLIGAVVSYSWGSRDAVVFPLLLPLVAMADKPTRLTLGAVRRVAVRAPFVVMLLMLVVGGSFALRALRDVTLTGRVQSTIADQTLVRRLSVASNHTQYDTFVLVMADTPEEMPRGGTAAVKSSLLAGVPAVIRPSGPAFVVPALTVAQFYEPARKNGWPMTAAGDWYWALGWGGLALGGALSGILTARLDGWRRRQRSTARAATNVYVLVWSSTIALGGFSLTSATRALTIGVPMLLLGVAMAYAPGFGRRTSESAAPVVRRTHQLVLPPFADLEVSVGSIGQGVRPAYGPWLPPRPRNWATLAPPKSSATPSHPTMHGVRYDLMFTVAANVFGLVIGLLIAVIASRQLGVTEFGRLSWAMTATYIGSTIAAVGLGLGVVALAPRDGDAETMRRFIGTALNTTTIAGLIVGTATMATAVLAPGLIGDDFVEVAKLCGLMMLPTAVLSVASAAFRITGRFGEAAIASEQVTRVAILIGVYAAILTDNLTASFAVAIAVAVLSVGAVVAFVTLGVSPTTALPMPWGRFVVDLVPFFLASVGATLIPQVGVVTLGLVRSADDVAILSAGLRVLMLCSLIAGAAVRVIGPRVARWNGPVEALTPFLRNASTLVFWSTFACALPFLVAGRWLIPFIFGDAFIDAWPPTVILLLGLLANVYAGSSGQLLFNTGHQKALSRVVLVSGLAFVPLSLAGGALGGAMGVAVTSTVLITGLNVWQARAALRWSGVRTWAYLAPEDIRRAVQDIVQRRGTDG